MSTSKGIGGGAVVVPAASRKMVQSLKEVLNLSEGEIYATLKDCNMDPNETVNRLLTQDPFHEVKSKREKKKEVKDTNESRPRGSNISTGRGGKSAADRYLGRGSSAPYYSSDSAPTYGKSSYKKENGAASYTSSLPLAPGLSGNNRNVGTAGFSDYTSAENKAASWSTTDGVPSGVQPTVASHSAWAGTPGQVSMADIVKMGRPNNKVASAPNGSHYNVQDPSRSSDDYASKDEWPSIEKPVVPIVKPPESTVDSHVHPEESTMHYNGENQDLESEDDEEEAVDYDVEISALNDTGSHSISSRKFPDDNSRGGPLSENNLYDNMGSYVPQAHDYEHHEVEEGTASVASVSRHLERLSVDKEDNELSSEGDAPSVIIPEHLQVQSTDCSHLSFGSFGSGMRVANSSGAASSLPIESKLEEQQAEVGVPSVGRADPRDSKYYGDDSFINTPDSGLYQRPGQGSDRFDTRTGPSSDRYDVSSATQHEQLKPESAEVHYPFPSSNTGYSYDNAQLLNAAFSQTNVEMQNQPSFSNVTQSYASSLPSTLLSANVRPSREPENQYSPFSLSSAMATKYASANSGAAASMPEALASMPQMQSAPHNLSGASVASGGQPLPQQLGINPYSQAPHPLGPYASMMGYPFVPQQNYYMPSAFQQALANNSPHHQSLGAVPPQYKNSASASSLQQAALAAIASGYGGLGNTGANSGNFPMNQPAAALPGASLSYDDVLSSQYKDTSHLTSLQQSENSSGWLQGLNSRTALPSGTYLPFHGQQQAQQPSGFRQSRQAASPNYGAPGYQNFYHSQAGMAQDHQPHNPRSGSQGQPKQSQNWQNMY